MNSTVNFLIGCYSQPLGDMAGNGEGICSASINLSTGEMSDPVCIAPCINPSYLAWSSDTNTLYATREVVRPDTPALMSFTRSAGSQWRAKNTVNLSGESPCHISVDPSGRLLASAQYVSGDIAVFELANDGSIGALCRLIQHSGQGPNVARQEGPHAHYATFHCGTLLTADLGIDAVLGYSADVANCEVSETPAIRVQTSAGGGPRHLAVLPGSTTTYALCELSEEISQLKLEAGSASVIDALPAFSGTHNNTGAASAIKISPDQHHVYVSGRNQSVIACFEIEKTSGKLTAIGEVDSGGIGPRDFALSPDGKFLIAANQISNNLTSFKRDCDSGRLEATGHRIENGSPVCVLFQDE